MLLSRILLFFALIDINEGDKNQRQSSKNSASASNTTFWSKYMFADVPDFDVEFTYEEVYSPDGIANQLLQNFFNWFCPTVFWFSFLPFYQRSVTNKKTGVNFTNNKRWRFKCQTPAIKYLFQSTNFLKQFWHFKRQKQGILNAKKEALKTPIFWLFKCQNWCLKCQK